jgi:hypothetical protein
MFNHHLSPLSIKLTAYCSGLSHRVGQGGLRPALQALQSQAILRLDWLPEKPFLCHYSALCGPGELITSRVPIRPS